MKTFFPIARMQSLPTPFYYYDEDLLQQTLEKLKQTSAQLGEVQLHYAVKANHNPHLLKNIVPTIKGADCVSGGEMREALKAGFLAEHMVFAGVGKADWEIEYALGVGISCFNVESLEELEVINQIAGRRKQVAPVALRINPHVEANTHAHITTGKAENKFGIDLSLLHQVVEQAQAMKNVRLLGLHFHIGSQITDMQDFVQLCNRINEAQQSLSLRGIRLEHINVGGGLGIDYQQPSWHALPDFEAYFSTFKRHLRLYPGQQLHFELGRSVVGQCGSLCTRVLFVKQGLKKQFVIVDAGMTDLMRPALYQSVHKVENLTSDLPAQTYDVVGPVCESSDVFAKDIALPACRRGDLLVIRSAGAYGESMASGYNCRSLPSSVFSRSLIVS